MAENLELHKILDSYIHKLVALHEVIPYQMTMAAAVAHQSAKKHKKFLDDNAEKLEEVNETTSYKLDFKIVGRSSRLGRRSDRAKTVLDLLPRNFVVSFVSEYDSFLGQAMLTSSLGWRRHLICL